MKARLTWLLDRTPTSLFVALVGIAAFMVGRAIGPAADDTPMGPDAADHAGSGEAVQHAEAVAEYVCPMHPQIRRSEPGTCPICFMELVPVESGGTADDGDTVLRLSDAAARLAGVRTEEVARVPLTEEIHVFGRVGTADSGEANITAWTGGRIERLYVETIGETVSRGQRLARIYSPELVVAQESLIHAEEILQEARASGSTARASAAEAAAEAARTQMRLLGITDRQIDSLVADGVADESVVIHAPAGGTVMRRFASEGDHVARGAPILSLADLAEVWVQLEIYERDLPRVTVGTPVQLRVPGASGAPIQAEIAFIDPVIDPERRVARARVVIDNASGAFRPDMFVEGVIRPPVAEADGRPPVSVPASAVLWTGLRSVVYVYDPVERPPVYMPIEVEVGDRVGGRVIIQSGLFPGEEVVVEGAFRLDASLQIRGGRSMMHPGGDDGGGAGEGGGGHVH